MISTDEIKLKEIYILEEISKITDKRELEKLKYSLRTYLFSWLFSIFSSIIEDVSEKAAIKTAVIKM